MVLTYPLFLLGLLSLVVPICIHLFELRRPKRILFTNVSFIREVRLITARQRKLKHLLVLFARLGFLFFLVLIFVQPYIPASIQVVNAGAVVATLVDATPSMQAGEQDDQSVFEKAIKQAQELSTAYPATTSFLSLNGAARPLSKAAYQLEVDRLTISGQASSLGKAFSSLNGKAGRADQVFVFSDFQKSGLLINSMATIDSSRQVFLVPIGSKSTQNAFVDSVWLDDAFIRSNADIVLRIRLRNGGNIAIENCQAKLFVGNQQAAVFRASLPVGDAVTLSVRVRLEGEALAECRIALVDYPVTFDNSYYFTLRPSPKLKVLDVAGTGSTAMGQLYANEPLFDYSASKAAGTDYRVSEAADIVVVQAQPRIDASLRESLRRVTQRGGSVVIVPPTETTSRNSYDQLFKELSIGPIQWEAAGSAAVLRDVAVPNSQNPFFKDVFGTQNKQPAMPKASPVLHWSRSGTDIMRMRDGDGFLASFSSGTGTVYLFSSPFSSIYSDFTQHALFVPVMYRLAMQSYRRQQEPAYRLNQGTIAVSVAEVKLGTSEQVFKLTKDSLTFIPSQRMQAGTLRFDVPPGMREPGFYKLTRNGEPIATIAFNYDKRESELATYSVEELRQLIGPNRPNVQVYDIRAEESVAAKYRAERVGTPLWQYCLWAALASLLAEVLLLRFMRQPKAVTPVAAAA